MGLAITLVLICLVSFLLNKHVGRGKDAKALRTPPDPIQLLDTNRRI